MQHTDLRRRKTKPLDADSGMCYDIHVGRPFGCLLFYYPDPDPGNKKAPPHRARLKPFDIRSGSDTERHRAVTTIAALCTNWLSAHADVK